MAKTTKTKPNSYAGQHLRLDPELLNSWKTAIAAALKDQPKLKDRFTISAEGVETYLGDRDVNRRFIEEAAQLTGVPIPDGLLNNRSSTPAKPTPARRAKSDEITKVQLSDVDADRFTSTLLTNGFEAYRENDRIIIVDPTTDDDGDLLVELVIRRVVHATRTKGQLKLTETVAGEVEIKPLGRIETTR